MFSFLEIRIRFRKSRKDLENLYLCMIERLPLCFRMLSLIQIKDSLMLLRHYVGSSNRECSNITSANWMDLLVIDFAPKLGYFPRSGGKS